MKKDPFWMILGIITTVIIIAGAGLSYINISKYSALQSSFEQNNSEIVNELISAKKKNELPTSIWSGEMEKIKSQLTNFFTALQESISSLKNESNIKSKHSIFLTKLAEENGFDISKYMLETIREVDIVEVKGKLSDWLGKLSKKEGDKPLSSFGRWYNDVAKNVIESVSTQDSTQKEEIETLLDLNSDYKNTFQNFYTDMTYLIKVIKSFNLPTEDTSKPEMISKFNLNYKTLIPSLLLSRYLLDNIPEFNNVQMKSIYIASFDPLKLSLIKNYKVKGDISSQITLCLCFDSAETSKTAAKTFLCNPPSPAIAGKKGEGKNKLFSLASLTTRYWDMTTDEATKDSSIQESWLSKSATLQSSLFPKELGTTIPLVFHFSSSYKNFFNLLKTLYKLNDKKEGTKNLFERLGINIAVPTAITKILFKLNNNISSDHFKFVRQEDIYPKERESEWLQQEAKLKEEAVKKLKETMDSSFDFFIEFLIYLYDPDALAECWKNIPSSTAEATIKTSKE